MQMACWAEYFEQLFMVNAPSGQLHTTGLQVVDADLPINEAAPSLDEVKNVVAKLRGGMEGFLFYLFIFLFIAFKGYWLRNTRNMLKKNSACRQTL